MKIWFGFSIKQNINSLSFLFLLTHIGLNFNKKKQCLKNRTNHKNLDLSYLKKKNWINQTKKNILKMRNYEENDQNVLCDSMNINKKDILTTFNTATQMFVEK